MIKKIAYSLVVVVAIIFMTGCSNTKQVAYFQNMDDVDLSASKGLFEARIMPKDELSITVHCSNSVAASVFNLAVSGATSNTGVGSYMSTQQKMLTYLVDNDGNINFPQLGKLHVVGMTKQGVQDMITEKIKPYFAEGENPIVTVTMANYRVTIFGEVGSPRVVSVSSEKMSIFEALASAGDLSIYGKRDNVLLIREGADGEKSVHRLNLNDANIINSPYYYVQQNDVIYVEPNTVKAKNSDIGQSTTLVFSFTSIMISLASLLYNILK